MIKMSLSLIAGRSIKQGAGIFNGNECAGRRIVKFPIRMRRELSSPYPSDEEVIGRLPARAKELKAC